jgi:hypothetical protein
MSPRVKKVHNQQSISQNTENLAIATLQNLSDLISGKLVLGVCPNLKVDGVALFLGNTLSLNKMVAVPFVVRLLS